jgi:hypothetical protein
MTDLMTEGLTGRLVDQTEKLIESAPSTTHVLRALAEVLSGFGDTDGAKLVLGFAAAYSKYEATQI